MHLSRFLRLFGEKGILEYVLLLPMGSYYIQAGILIPNYPKTLGGKFADDLFLLVKGALGESLVPQFPFIHCTCNFTTT